MTDACWSFYFFLVYFLRGVALRVAFMGHWGGTLVAFTVLVGFYWALGLDFSWRFSAFVVYMTNACWSCYFLFSLFFAWCGVACSVYGELGWDPCGVYSVSRFLLGIGVGRFVALFSVCSVYDGCMLVFLFFLIYFLRGVALRVAFMGHWGGTLVAFTVLVGFYWALGLEICGAFQRL